MYKLPYKRNAGMTSQDGVDVREVSFINERCRVDYEAMPAEVRESADQAIDALQNARPLPAKLYQPLHDTLAGIHEIRLPHDANTYRVYVTLKCPWINHGARRRHEEVD
jgi:Phage derived protein Gp49-like (DUF891)